MVTSSSSSTAAQTPAVLGRQDVISLIKQNPTPLEASIGVRTFSNSASGSISFLTSRSFALPTAIIQPQDNLPSVRDISVMDASPLEPLSGAAMVIRGIAATDNASLLINGKSRAVCCWLISLKISPGTAINGLGSLPLPPAITPALSVAGVILMVTGVVYTLIGIKNAWFV